MDVRTEYKGVGKLGWFMLKTSTVTSPPSEGEPAGTFDKYWVVHVRSRGKQHEVLLRPKHQRSLKTVSPGVSLLLSYSGISPNTCSGLCDHGRLIHNTA